MKSCSRTYGSFDGVRDVAQSHKLQYFLENSQLHFHTDLLSLNVIFLKRLGFANRVEGILHNYWLPEVRETVWLERRNAKAHIAPASVAAFPLTY